MTDRLKKVLLSTDFKNRYGALFSKHSHKNLFKNADPKQVQVIVEKLGYVCTYNKSGKFFKVDNVQPKLCLNLSTDIGIVEFILDTTIDCEGDGGPFNFMFTSLSSDNNIKAPRFSSYEELEEILGEGFRIYEDIKKSLLDTSL